MILTFSGLHFLFFMTPLNFQQGLVQPPVEQKWSKRITVHYGDETERCRNKAPPSIIQTTTIIRLFALKKTKHQVHSCFQISITSVLDLPGPDL